MASVHVMVRCGQRQKVQEVRYSYHIKLFCSVLVEQIPCVTTLAWEGDKVFGSITPIH